MEIKKEEKEGYQYRTMDVTQTEFLALIKVIFITGRLHWR